MKLRKNSRISSTFGYRIHPLYDTKHFHRGVDLVSNDGMVYAGMKGKVIRSQMGKYGEGNYIQTKTNVKGVTFYVNYFHNEENYVQIDDYVNVDAKIAKQGTTGESTGVHSHFEIYIYNRDIVRVSKIMIGVKSRTLRYRTFFSPFKLLQYLKTNYGG